VPVPMADPATRLNHAGRGKRRDGPDFEFDVFEGGMQRFDIQWVRRIYWCQPGAGFSDTFGNIADLLPTMPFRRSAAFAPASRSTRPSRFRNEAVRARRYGKMVGDDGLEPPTFSV
jgi:hypothetical protein